MICKEFIEGGLISFGFGKFVSKEVLIKWKEAVGKGPNWTPKLFQRICARHFEKKYFLETSKYSGNSTPKLREDAVPTLNLDLKTIETSKRVKEAMKRRRGMFTFASHFHT